LSELGPDARSLLDAVREGDEPSSADAARIRARLALQLGVTAAAGTIGTLTAKSAAGAAGAAGAGAAGTAGGVGLAAASSVLAIKVLVALAVAACTVMLAVHVLPLGMPPARTVSPSSPASVPAAAVAARSVRRAGDAPSVRTPSAGGAVAAAGSEGGGLAVGAPAADAALAAGGGALAASAPPRHATIAVPSPSTASAAHQSRPTPMSSALPASASGSGSASASTPPAGDPLQEEASLIRAAHAALSTGDAGAAMTLLDEHARRFPHGVLAEDRSGARVHALCASGRADDARAAASAFVAAHPRSALTPAVRRSCAESPPR